MSVFSGHRPWVYPLKSNGLFTRLHKLSSSALVLFLVVVPWLRWNGEPLFLADLATRRLYLLGQIYTPNDSVILMLLALAAAFALFFFTTLLGRLWCGYFCPQSVFMINLVFPIEEWIEGPRAKRMQRDRGPMNFDRAWRKAAKWSLFAGFSVLVSMSFMGFFARTSLLWTGQATYGNYAVVAFFSSLWFLDFAWYREQTCNFICPYARFQGALTDDHSLVISYDIERGEPRGKEARERGGCIDCNKCVVVCPQGIDIREGYQMECIACGRCIDACDSVLTKLGHPTLVRYSTAAKDEKRPAVGWLRPRAVIYGGLLVALFSAVGFKIATHELLELQVDRAPGSLFIEDEDGYVRNTYMVHVLDKNVAEGDRVYAVAVEGLPEGSQVRARPLILGTSERASVPVIVRVPRALAEQTIPLTVRVHGQDVDVERATTFKGPGQERASLRTPLTPPT